MNLLTILLLATLPADEAPVRFREDVAPILVARCVGCHGPKKAVAGYRVDTYARLMAESKAGKSIEPGKPDDSLFLELVIQAEPTGRMPKNADPLPAQEIAILRRWIEQGAKADGVEPTVDLASILPRSARAAAPDVYPAAVPIMALAFSPDGTTIAAGGYREVTLWDSSTGKLARRLPGIAQRTQGLAFSPDGSTLVIAGGVPGESGEVALIDLKSSQPPRELATSPDIFLGLAMSADGSMVGLSGADRSLRVVEVATGKELCQVKQFADWVTAVAFDRDGKSVAGSSLDKLVKVFEARTGKLETTYIGHNASVLSVAFDPESNRAVSAGADRKIHAWDPKVIAAEDGTAGQQEDRFKKDLAAKLVGGFGDEVIKVVVSKGRAFCASADGKVVAVDLKTHKQAQAMDGQGDWVYALAASPDGTRLAGGASDGSIRIWDVESGKVLVEFLAAPGLVTRR